MKIDTILVPTDFSDDAKRALETATDLAVTFGSRIVLLHTYHIETPLTSPVFGGPVILPEGFFVDYRNLAIQQIERLAEEAAETGIDVTTIAIESRPWIGILDQAQKANADLIVMGTRGLTGIKHVALGSTAERVVRQAKCPVLTVKAEPAT